MKYNIKLITALALGSLLAVTALNAQEKSGKPARPEGAPPGEGRPGPQGGGEAAKERLAKMAEELNLTDAQKTKVQAAMKEQADKRKELRDATPEERQEKAKAMREEMNKKMKEILTAEQYTKWEKMRPTPGQRPGGQGGERRRPAGEKPADKA